MASFSYRVHYICCSGRNFKDSEEVLEIDVDDIKPRYYFHGLSDFMDEDPPAEFFAAIEQLMSSQCRDLCTSQYKTISLCPVYVKRCDLDEIDMIYYKFSDEFMDRMRSIKASSQCR